MKLAVVAQQSLDCCQLIGGHAIFGSTITGWASGHLTGGHLQLLSLLVSLKQQVWCFVCNTWSGIWGVVVGHAVRVLALVMHRIFKIRIAHFLVRGSLILKRH